MTRTKTALLFTLCMVASSTVSAETYQVSRTGRVADTKYCFSFQIPPNWRLAAGNPVPLLFNLHHYRGPFGQDLPDNTASIALGAGPASGEKPRSIDEWIALRERAHPRLVRQKLVFAASTGMTDATRVEWIDAEDVEGGETPTQTVGVFFMFRRAPFAVYLSYKNRANFDREFRAGLTAVLNSFRPVTTGRACRPT